jgi:hypothetical protein
MVLPLVANIIQITQDSFLDATGKPVYVINVRFKVGDHGPFTVPIPREVFTAEVAKRAMQPTVEAINGLLK